MAFLRELNHRQHRSVGLGEGHPWCAAFGHHVGRHALWDPVAKKSSWPLPATASCWELGDFARRNGILRASPMFGDVFLQYKPELGRYAHTGFVAGVHSCREEGDWAVSGCTTIEGKTNEAGSRDGDGTSGRPERCGRTRRRWKEGDAFIRWVDLDRAHPRAAELPRSLRRRWYIQPPMKKRTILVTGGAGHVGSHVIELLLEDAGNRVISLDNYLNGSVENHIPGAEYREGHTKDIDRLIPETPDIVYHLGEYARIAPSFEDVKLVYDMNIAGTFAVAEFCRARKVKKLVYAASSTKFAIEGDGRHQNPYSFTKATNVDLINDYGRWYRLPYAICYFYNAFGPRERGDGKYGTVIAKFQQQYLRGEPLTVVRPGTQRRAFTYVKDLARGIVLVGRKGKGDGYALGQTRTYSVMQIAKAFGGPVKLMKGYPGRAEARNDPRKARTLGWKPSVDVMDYIARVVAANPR